MSLHGNLRHHVHSGRWNHVRRPAAQRKSLLSQNRLSGERLWRGMSQQNDTGTQCALPQMLSREKLLRLLRSRGNSVSFGLRSFDPGSMSDGGDNGPISLNPTGASPDTPKTTLRYLLRRKTSKTLSQKGRSGFEGLYAARVMLQAK
jgi:hypothetical protein